MYRLSVEEPNPLKQGLKHFVSWARGCCLTWVEEPNPLKQGLKLSFQSKNGLYQTG